MIGRATSVLLLAALISLYIGSGRSSISISISSNSNNSGAAEGSTSTSTTTNTNSNSNTNRSDRRRFVSYHSSEWEKLWLANVKEWSHDPPRGDICGNVKNQTERFVRRFMAETCTARAEGNPWCLVDDTYVPYWYDVDRHVVSMKHPPGAAPLDDYKGKGSFAVIPRRSKENDRIFSRLVYADDTADAGAGAGAGGTDNEYTEYIEPLVSHLRHPLAGCVDADFFDGPFQRNEDRLLVFTRSYILPLPRPFDPAAKNYYFDAGASSWTKGAGGPSLSIIDALWARHNTTFDRIEAWEGTTTEKSFYADVPPERREAVRYHQAWISSDPAETDPNKPFLPRIIRNATTEADYVFFKLDIDSLGIETGTVDHLLSPDNEDLDYIDEFAWEHHVRSNYIMAKRGWCPGSCDYSKNMLDSYNYFLRLRQKGVRAHSWT